MTAMQTLNNIFKTVFDDQELEIEPEMTANDVEGWDSLSHINLITAIELAFLIKFSRKEIMTFRNVGEMIACIESKISAATGK